MDKVSDERPMTPEERARDVFFGWGDRVERMCADAIRAALAAESARQPAPAEVEAVARSVEAIVRGLADQQAMPDDWWKPELAGILARLRAAAEQAARAAREEAYNRGHADGLAAARALNAATPAAVAQDDAGTGDAGNALATAICAALDAGGHDSEVRTDAIMVAIDAYLDARYLRRKERK